MTIDWDMVATWGCLVFVLGMAAILVLAALDSIKSHERFMVECTKERKEYECVAMWRAGDGHVAPMPIVVPVGR